MKIKLKEVVKKKVTNENGTFVCDLTVKDNHNYLVGENQVIVHNCLTAQQVGVGAAMASLIDDCRQVINNSGDERSGIEPFNTKIVADGGMKKYSDIIKAIALGADYVMLGSVLNKALESCAVTTNEQGEVVDQYDPKAVEFVKNGGKLFKQFRGMSTKEVQKTWNKNEIKTSEGVVRNWPVEYTVGGWVENFNHYLRSMLYQKIR